MKDFRKLHEITSGLAEACSSLPFILFYNRALNRVVVLYPENQVIISEKKALPKALLSRFSPGRFPNEMSARFLALIVSLPERKCRVIKVTNADSN